MLNPRNQRKNQHQPATKTHSRHGAPSRAGPLGGGALSRPGRGQARAGHMRLVVNG